MPVAIRAEGLRKEYGDTVGVDRVDLSVEQGAMIGFIGPNGAGKSTTIRLLLGLLKPTAGASFLFGNPTWMMDSSVFVRVGYLPSTVSYFDRMRVGAFLKAAGRFYDSDCSARAAELCALLDVDLSRRFGELSMGNRKKVGIVQCFMHRPELVVLDEPTSGLDPLVQARFFSLLREENERGVTVFCSSHTLSEVQDHCRTVVIIRGGRIVESGDVRALRKAQFRRIRLIASADAHEAVSRLGAAAVESRDGDAAVYLFRGPIAGFLAAVEPEAVRDLIIEEPSLEEIFLHYYRGGASGDAE